MNIKPQVIRACLLKQPAAQKELYVQLFPYLNALSYRYLNDNSLRSDVLQDVFVKIFTKLSTYDEQKGSIKSWAARILINTCLDYNRRSDSMRFQQVELSDVTVPVNPEIVMQLNNEALLAFIKCLPESLYSVFNLFVIDGFSHKEIGQLLEIDEASSRKKLSRAKAYLRDQIERKKKLNKLHLNRSL